MSLFAHRLCVDDPLDAPPLPGRFDDARSLRVDEDGTPVANGLAALPTRADRDRPDDLLLMGTQTKAITDRDETPPSTTALLMSTKTAGGIDNDDHRLLGTTTLAGPDRDD